MQTRQSDNGTARVGTNILNYRHHHILTRLVASRAASIDIRVQRRFRAWLDPYLSPDTDSCAVAVSDQITDSRHVVAIDIQR